MGGVRLPRFRDRATPLGAVIGPKTQPLSGRQSRASCGALSSEPRQRPAQRRCQAELRQASLEARQPNLRLKLTGPAELWKRRFVRWRAPTAS